MSNDDVHFERDPKDERLWTVILSNPEKRNTLTPSMLNKLSEFLRNREWRENIRVLVLRGEGKIAFSAGYDISKIKFSSEEGAEEASSTILYRALREIEDFPAPVIGMINGFCVGAGCHLAVSLDLRIACEEAKLGITPAKIGIVYHPEGIGHFIKLIGASKTKELFYTGKLYSAEEAKAMGLVDYVVPSEKLEETVYEMAEQIASNSPLSVQGTKYIVNGWNRSVVMDFEARQHAMKLRQEAFLSEDYAEGRKAFSERRKPVFKGQ